MILHVRINPISCLPSLARVNKIWVPQSVIVSVGLLNLYTDTFARIQASLWVLDQDPAGVKYL